MGVEVDMLRQENRRMKEKIIEMKEKYEMVLSCNKSDEISKLKEDKEILLNHINNLENLQREADKKKSIEMEKLKTEQERLLSQAAHLEKLQTNLNKLINDQKGLKDKSEVPDRSSSLGNDSQMKKISQVFREQKQRLEKELKYLKKYIKNREQNEDTKKKLNGNVMEPSKDLNKCTIIDKRSEIGKNEMDQLKTSNTKLIEEIKNLKNIDEVFKEQKQRLEE